MPRSKGIVIGFWIVTALSAADGLSPPTRNCAFHKFRRRSPPRLPAYFRVELSWPAPRRGAAACAGAARLRSGAYAGFAIDIGSALIAHLSWAMPGGVGLGAATGVLWGSVLFWRRLQATSAGVGGTSDQMIVNLYRPRLTCSLR